MRGDSLVYHNYNTQSKASFLCVRQVGDHLVTGCEEGHLYLWYNYELVHVIQNAHTAAVRCLEVDREGKFIVSGGKDGMVLMLRLEANKLHPFHRVELNSPGSKA